MQLLLNAGPDGVSGVVQSLLGRNSANKSKSNLKLSQPPVQPGIGSNSISARGKHQLSGASWVLIVFRTLFFN